MENSQSSIKHKKRKIFLLIFLMFITTIVLVVSTYAWFIGTGSVNTSSFVLDIGVADELELSLDGEHWEDDTLEISKDIILGTSGTNKGYTGNKNKWPDTGLMPISSNGVVDNNGRLELYEMSMITATNGGFRFTANKINNATAEKEGYLAFDLFIKNGEADAYTTTYDELDNEAVYLTKSSEVKVSPSGSNTEDYGLANSIRLAFAQIGRVKWNTTPVSAITGINCSNTSPNTGLCSDVTPTVWEPNNLRHNSNLIAYYNNTCKTRTGATAYTTTACTTFTDNEDVDTYVVKQNIASSTRTDIYDIHNGFANTSLNNLDTFTDTMKNTSGQTREPFMYLAANSITKVRVYIYLEGQDVDNYDLISNGNKISINFGFTKNYDDTLEIPGMGSTTTLARQTTNGNYEYNSVDFITGNSLTSPYFSIVSPSEYSSLMTLAGQTLTQGDIDGYEHVIENDIDMSNGELYYDRTINAFGSTRLVPIILKMAINDNFGTYKINTSQLLFIGTAESVTTYGLEDVSLCSIFTRVEEQNGYIDINSPTTIYMAFKGENYGGYISNFKLKKVGLVLHGPETLRISSETASSYVDPGLLYGNEILSSEYYVTTNNIESTPGNYTYTYYVNTEDGVKIFTRNIIVDTPTNANCFAFDSSTGTITQYYYFENNNTSNTACPMDVVIPEQIGGVNVTKIGEYAFTYDSATINKLSNSNKEYKINNLLQQNKEYNISKIGMSLPEGLGITSVVFPSHLTEIGYEAFASNNLTYVVLPSSIENIETHAFAKNQIESVILNDNLEFAGGAFRSNKIHYTDIIFPSTYNQGYSCVTEGCN